MRQPVLVVVFEQCAGIADDIKTGAVFGFLVVADVIRDAVGQFAHYGVRVRRQWTRKVLRMTPRKEGNAGQK